MPLYEYRCSKCEQKFEIIQKFSDEPLTLHEACGGPVERLVSAPALQFKGSGWYITDYARSGGSKSPEGKSGEAKTESKSETKSESKSDSKGSDSGSSSTSSSSSSGSTPAPAAPSK